MTLIEIVHCPVTGPMRWPSYGFSFLVRCCERTRFLLDDSTCRNFPRSDCWNRFRGTGCRPYAADVFSRQNDRVARCVHQSLHHWICDWLCPTTGLAGLVGLLFGLLISLPDAIVTHKYVPILILGGIGGLIIGGLIHGWKTNI